MQEFFRLIDQDPIAQQVIAFSMSLNACVYVNQVAQNKPIPDIVLPAYIPPTLSLNPERVSELLPCPLMIQSSLGAFLMLLKSVHLHRNEKHSRAHQSILQAQELRHIITYLHGTLKLKKHVLGHHKKLAQLSNRLHIIARFKALQIETEQIALQQLSQKLAALYLDIFGSLSFRIIIQGRQEALADPHKIEQIRCLLLSAIRFSVLWQQVGGRHWKLLFARGAMFKKATQLYQEIQKVQLTTPSNIIQIKP